MKKNFTASILKKIHAKKITPRERYYFIAKTILQICLGIVFLLFGMISVALVWHLIHNFEFAEFILERPQILGKLFWFGVPFFWMILSITLWVVTEKIAQQTDRLYRIPLWGIGAIALLVQIFGGLALEQSRVGERLDILFEQRIEWYHGAERINRHFERMPEEGFLVGRVIKIESGTLILLNDRTEKVWKVHFETLENPRVEMKEGMIIRMVGEVTRPGEFFADHWKPERPPRMMPKENFPQQRKDRRDMRLPTHP